MACLKQLQFQLWDWSMRPILGKGISSFAVPTNNHKIRWKTWNQNKPRSIYKKRNPKLQRSQSNLARDLETIKSSHIFLATTSSKWRPSLSSWSPSSPSASASRRTPLPRQILERPMLSFGLRPRSRTATASVTPTNGPQTESSWETAWGWSPNCPVIVSDLPLIILPCLHSEPLEP